jgi:hypothetical protein
LLIAAGAAVVTGLWLSGTMAKDVTAELITFFGIQAAIILPAMIFTAGILRPEGLSLPEAQRYRKALRSQMVFWIVLLALDFLTVVGLIVGKATDWEVTVPAIRGVGPTDMSWLLIGAATFLGVLALLRTIPFVKGVLSLQELNSELTEKAIKVRDSIALEQQRRDAEAEPFKKPEGYGKVTERH